MLSGLKCTMAESVTVVCRVDSLNDKHYIDKQVSILLKMFKRNLKGRKSELTLTSELERKFFFHELSIQDAEKLKLIATDNKSKMCLKSVVIGANSPATPPAPQSAPVLVVPSPTISADSLSSSSVSSDTKSLVLNFGVGDSTNSSSISPSSPASSSNSFFSSDSDTSGIGVGTQVATPEILLLRELADIMKVESRKPTPSQIGKAVSTWFVSENVQKVMRRIA